ncbi:hypothetical protein P3342_000036 [Pyrenophora teres f. teres]|nr:hypothetical protein P3342_000036 [Pyrenophora teres f. teres]
MTPLLARFKPASASRAPRPRRPLLLFPPPHRDLRNRYCKIANVSSQKTELLAPLLHTTYNRQRNGCAAQLLQILPLAGPVPDVDSPMFRRSTSTRTCIRSKYPYPLPSGL